MAYIRDSKTNYLGSQQSIITVDRDEWSRFQETVLSNQPSTDGGRLVFKKYDDGNVAIVDVSTNTGLHYDKSEWSAFVDGVKSGRFTTRYQEFATT